MVSRNRRQTKWFTTLRTLQALADNTQLTFPLLADLSASQTQGATITRILIELWIANDITNNAKTMDWGIVLLAGEAVTAGGIPDAQDEDERVDWMGRGRMHVITNNISVMPNFAHMERDLRAQRIIRDEFQELRLITNLDANGTGGVFLTIFTRVLVKMP